MQQVPERHSNLDNDNGSPDSDEFSRQYEALLQTADTAATARSMRGLFADLLEQFVPTIQFDHLGFSLHDPARNVLITHPLVQKGAFRIPAELPVEGSLETILLQHCTIEVHDTDIPGEFEDLRALSRKVGLRSFRAIPLATERRTLGTIGVAE